jgi:uncharacterized membrane protein YsdA (DUF1294 family)
MINNYDHGISEETFLTFAAVGGTIGAALAMYLFRHKTKKKYYLLNFTES